MNTATIVDARWYYDGNIKVGNIATFSTLPGDKEYETKYGVVKGTCDGCCEYCGKSVDGKRPKCFVYKSHRFPDVIESQARNTLSVINDTELAFRQLSDSLKRKKKLPTACRTHQSGEFMKDWLGVKELEETCKMATEHPNMPFYFYTKRYGIAIPALLAGKVPKNLTVLISIWHEQGIREYLMLAHLPNVKTFVCCDSNEDRVNGWGVEEYAQHGIIIQTFCAAYDIHGKMNHKVTCDKCKKCFNRSAKAKVIGTWSH